MAAEQLNSLAEHFSNVNDPRGPNVTHQLFDIIALAILGTICGADGWVESEQFGHQKLNWLRQYLWLGNGIPSHDTLGRVFSQIDPAEFQASFMKWVQALHQITQGQVIGIDGKQLRGSHDHSQGKRAIYMVSAWAAQNHLVLGTRQVAEKSNEITAIPELLRLLEIKGCLVTVDAIGTQTKIAKQIIKAEGNYLLAVKHNQGKLYRDLEILFSYDQQHGFKDTPYDYDKEVKKGRGRIPMPWNWLLSSQENQPRMPILSVSIVPTEKMYWMPTCSIRSMKLVKSPKNGSKSTTPSDLMRLLMAYRPLNMQTLKSDFADRNEWQRNFIPG